MKHNAFSNINWDATYEATKSLLEEYIDFEMTAARSEVLLASPTLSLVASGHGVENSNEQRATIGMQEAEEAKFEMALIENTIKCMHDIDPKHETYSQLLTYRYIDGMKIEDVRKQIKLEHNYHIFIAERTYHDMLKEACWSFAMIYPREDIRVKIRSISAHNPQ